MIDLENMIKSLRLAWLKRIFQCNTSAGLEKLFTAFVGRFWGGSFYFIVIMTSVKRSMFPLNSVPNYFNGGLNFVVFSIVEGNANIFCGITKEIRVDNKPVFYEKIFEKDVIFVNDLLFEIDTTNSFTIVSNKISKINYLLWAGLRHSVPTNLKTSNCLRSEISLILAIDNKRNLKITTC